MNEVKDQFTLCLTPKSQLEDVFTLNFPPHATTRKRTIQNLVVLWNAHASLLIYLNLVCLVGFRAGFFDQSYIFNIE